MSDWAWYRAEEILGHLRMPRGDLPSVQVDAMVRDVAKELRRERWRKQIGALTEIRFEDVWEQDYDVVLRKEDDRLVVELSCDQDGEYMRCVVQPVQLALHMENKTGVFAATVEVKRER